MTRGRGPERYPPSSFPPTMRSVPEEPLGTGSYSNMDSIQPGLHMVLDRGELLKSLRAFKRGDFTVRMPLSLTGIDGEIAQSFNDVIELEEAKAAEIARVADQVVREGQVGQRMSVPGATGSWAEVVDSMNMLLGDMMYPVTEVARVIGSVAKGDLSQTMMLEPDG